MISAAAESNWPQWRGPEQDGQFTGPAWPEKVDSYHPQRTGRVELGPSYSGPIVEGDRLFTTGSKDKKFEVVTAFDRKMGKELWRAQWVGVMTMPFFAKSNGGWIRAMPHFGFVCSPLVDGEFVCVQAGANFVKLNKRTNTTSSVKQ